MLSMSELAMNPNRKVTTVCYGKKQDWDDREEAQAYFLEAMMNSDGAEHDRYSGIYIQLQNGLDYCTDEDDDEEDDTDWSQPLECIKARRTAHRAGYRQDGFDRGRS